MASRDGHYGPTSTWTAFRAIEPGRRIDYVLVSPQVRVLKHAILPDSWNDRFPSDHLPVLAGVERWFAIAVRGSRPALSQRDPHRRRHR